MTNDDPWKLWLDQLVIVLHQLGVGRPAIPRGSRPINPTKTLILGLGLGLGLDYRPFGMADPNHQFNTRTLLISWIFCVPLSCSSVNSSLLSSDSPLRLLVNQSSSSVPTYESRMEDMKLDVDWEACGMMISSPVGSWTVDAVLILSRVGCALSNFIDWLQAIAAHAPTSAC